MVSKNSIDQPFSVHASVNGTLLLQVEDYASNSSKSSLYIEQYCEDIAYTYMHNSYIISFHFFFNSYIS